MVLSGLKTNHVGVKRRSCRCQEKIMSVSEYMDLPLIIVDIVVINRSEFSQKNKGELGKVLPYFLFPNSSMNRKHV